MERFAKLLLVSGHTDPFRLQTIREQFGDKSKRT